MRATLGFDVLVAMGLGALLALGGAACGDSVSGPGGGALCQARAGDLVITELVANPAGSGADEEPEWIELYNPTPDTIDLRGLRLVIVNVDNESRSDRTTIRSDDPVLIAPGEYVTVSEVLPRGDHVYSFGDEWPGLTNGGGVIAIACLDGSEVDRACYGNKCVPEQSAPGEGDSFALTAPGQPNYATNDDPLSWSIEDEPTPRAANPEREPAVLNPNPDCESEVGPLDPSVTVAITEVLGSPAGSDAKATWFELTIDVPVCVNLDGVVFNTAADAATGGHTVSAAGGQTLYESGTYVFAAPTAVLPGISVSQFAKVDPKNTDGVLAMWSGETRLALADIGDSTKGVARQWDAATEVWCNASKPAPGGTGAYVGTPGEANPPCGACFCDSGDGTIAQAVAPAPGQLVVTEVMADVPGSETDNAAMEWIEVHVPASAPAPVALACVKLGKDRGATSLQGLVNPDNACFTAAPGDYVVLGRSSNPAANGGVDVDAVYEGLSLTGSGGGVALFDAAGVVLDEVTSYGSSKEGVARQVNPDEVAMGDAALNDFAGAWCDASEVLNATLATLGTPGDANSPCPETGGAYTVGEDPTDCVSVLGPTDVGVVIEITEVFANPSGSDTGREWFEVYIEAPGCVSMDGVDVNKSPAVAGGPVHTVGAQTGQTLFRSGGYYLFVEQSANVGDETIASQVTGSLSLGNSDGVVALWSGAELLASASYGAASDGKAAQWVDGVWCDSPQPGGEGDAMFFGSPGAANPACGACFCDDGGGAAVAVDSPRVGDLMITEVLADVPGSETENAAMEWIEVHVPATASGPVPLGCVQVAKDSGAGPNALVNPGGGCLPIGVGEYRVLGRSTDQAENGGVAVDVAYEGLAMTGSGGVALFDNQGALLDEVVSYGSSTEGVARQVDPDVVALGDVAGNDQAGAWCDASDELNQALGTKGSPGAANAVCPEIGGGFVVGEDPTDCASTVGPLDSGVVVEVTEVFANPDGTDGDREWFEIFVDGPGCVSLDGVQLIEDVTVAGTVFHTIEAAAGQTLFRPGEHYLFVNTEADLGDPLTVVAQITTSLSLNNSSGKLGLWSGGTLVAGAEYGTPTSGRATQWFGGGWCDSPKPAPGGTFYGSPGEVNPACDACFCTDGAGGFREATPPAVGEVLVTEVFANVVGTEGDGVGQEWFEVLLLPTAAGVRSMACVGVGRAAGDSPAALVNPDAACHDTLPGTYFVLGRSDDAALNNNAPVDAVYGSVTFTNSGGVALFGPGGVLLDQVLSYGAAADGVSRQLDPTLVLAATATTNDPDTAWCDSSSVFDATSGAIGTPGANNEPCPLP